MKVLIGSFILFLSFLFASTAFAYTVTKGDTMTKIAAESNMTLQQLADKNPQIHDLNRIYVGETVHTAEFKNSTNPQILNLNHINTAQTYGIESSNHAINPPAPASLTDDNMDKLGRLVHTNALSRELANADSPKPTVDKTIPTVQSNYSTKDIDLLARLVRAEAQSEPFEGKIAVACVVLNRVESTVFPHTIRGVIYERGQFQPVKNGEINKSADHDSIEAVKEALTKKRHLAHDSLFFYNPVTARSHWLASRPTTLVLGRHVFKK